MTIEGILVPCLSVRELCKCYELPANLETALRAEAHDYENESRRISQSLNSLQRTIASALDSAERNKAFWRESRYISQKASDIYEKSAAIEVKVNTICVLIDLCADEVMFNTIVNGKERSDEFRVAARSIIFGVTE